MAIAKTCLGEGLLPTETVEVSYRSRAEETFVVIAGTARGHLFARPQAEWTVTGPHGTCHNDRRDWIPLGFS